MWYPNRGIDFCYMYKTFYSYELICGFECERERECECEREYECECECEYE